MPKTVQFTELNTLLCVAQRKLKPSTLGIVFLADLSRAVTFGEKIIMAYLCSPVDEFRGFSPVAFELLWLHQERPVLV